MTALTVAIVGAGPAGFYVADRLLRRDPDTRIAVIDRLPTPFGLVRAGVAPDHQGTKAVSRLFQRLLNNKQVSFFGNLDVGCDITLQELEDLFDAVVIAVGADRDRRLGIPGESLNEVYSSGALVGWYNSHPDHASLKVDLASMHSAVIIGNGNVAIDVARILTKSPGQFAGSDLGARPSAQLAASPLRDIHIVGRGGPEQTKFSPAEFAELRDLTPAEGRRIHFHYGLSPESFLGSEDGTVSAARFRNAAGEIVALDVQLVVTCIGYQRESFCDLSCEGGVIVNQDGVVRDRLFVTGWAARGPTGTIAINRPESHRLADMMLESVRPGGRDSAGDLRKVLERRNIAVVNAAGWSRIDAVEQARAAPHRLREKLVRIEDMLEAARAVE